MKSLAKEFDVGSGSKAGYVSYQLCDENIGSIICI